MDRSRGAPPRLGFLAFLIVDKLWIDRAEPRHALLFRRSATAENPLIVDKIVCNMWITCG